MKKAVLPIGVNNKGLTLVETLLAALILSSAIVFIAPAIFKSGGILAHVERRYGAELLINNLIAQRQEDLQTHLSLDERNLEGEEGPPRAPYFYKIETFAEDTAGRLYRLTVHVNWRDFKENHLSKTAYILR